MPEVKQIPSQCEFGFDKLIAKLDEVIPSDVGIIDDAVAAVARLLQERGCEKDLERIDLALREALANAIIHGNRNDPEKRVRVCVTLREDCGILIVVKDCGQGFDPNQVPDPLSEENLLSGHGRGIFLINQLMDEVRFAFDSGTAILMRRRPAPSR